MMLATGLAQADTSYQGPPVRIGKGSAHTVVHVDDSGKAVAVGLVLSAAALQGLPKPTGEHTDFAYQLRMPAKGPKTVVDHVVVNWESTGHPPPKVYDVPHFDFHFYLVSRHEQMQVSFNSEAESGDPAQQPPAELLPAGYVVPPGTAVPQMGVHAINPAAGEFQGQPFTATFIYGYHQQQLTFLEPMASLAFLQSQPDFSAAVPRPASYSKPGSYPASYSVRYQRASKSYEILLSELQ
ncbi:DUF5602 domain-containing protein [Vogesella sp. LIG4]|uniref:DUF5602 domain-containing protein n=1 Tax=Vogesella sp. LIG4 TaxID=1192162 RepID=UPI001E4A48DC|nr:DUF5602 domain-containing protein [Vogesella sp. LIG4]